MTYGIDKKKFCECLKDKNIKKEREEYSRRIRMIADPLLQELKKRGYSAILTGLAAKDMALKTSPIQLYIIEKTEKLREIGCFFENYGFVKTAEINKYSFVQKYLGLLKFHQVEVYISDYDFDYYSTYDLIKPTPNNDDVLDTVYCMNKLFAEKNMVKKNVIKHHCFVKKQKN